MKWMAIFRMIIGRFFVLISLYHDLLLLLTKLSSCFFCILSIVTYVSKYFDRFIDR